MERTVEPQNLTVLIVEDDPDINNLLKRILERAKLNYIQAYSGTEAKLILEAKKVDLVLLDLMLPGIRGEELISSIRQDKKLKIPIITISAKVSVDDKVKVLESGADDYIAKPFDPNEVLARINVALRRIYPQACQTGTYKHRELSLDRGSRRVLCKDKEIELTAHEFDLLEILMQSPDTVFSRERLYQMVWKSGYYGEDNTINVHMSNIRKKLAAASSEKYIETVWGIGFKLI